MCIKKELGNDGWLLFDEWRKKCEDKYDSDKNREIWDSMEPKDNMNINVLKKWIKDDASKEDGDIAKDDIDVSDALIAKMIKENISYVSASRGKYYVYGNHKWKEVSKISFKDTIVKNFINIIAKKLSETQEQNQREQYLFIMKSMSNNSFLKNIMPFIEMETNDDDLFEKFDSNNKLIAFSNGVYDLNTRSFRDGKPDDYISFSAGYEYLTIEQSQKDLWNNLLADIFPDPEVRMYYKRIMAFTFAGDKRFENFFFHKGKGGNGKGVLGDLMKKVFGEYFSVMSVNQLTIASKNKNEANPELANKKGKRIALSTELEEKQTLQIGALKQWTGNDVIEARMLYGQPFTFTPYFTNHLQTNDFPIIPKIDDALIRRLRVIDYPTKFCENPVEPHERKVNPLLKNVIANEPELWNAVACDLIEIYNSCAEMTDIPMPEEVRKHTNNYIDDNDMIKMWFNENIEKSAGSKIKARDLYNDYAKWCNNDPKKMTETAFGKILVERFKMEKKKIKTGTIYENITFKCDADCDSDSDGETEDI
jgi:P4 family phage/plasmid primase-like protien